MEGIVSNLVSKSLEAMGKAALKEVASWWGAQGDLKKLEKTMRLIQARVLDAENRQEADGSEAIKEWLRRLKLVLYKADDLFDEVLTRERQEKRMESIFDKVGLLFSTSSPLYHIPKLARHIKSIRKELDAIKSDMSGLNLRDLPAQQLPMVPSKRQQRESAPLYHGQETKFISRDTDQNNILEMLFDSKYDSERVTVIRIVGIGGLGKTTLAQLVFNDQRVKECFDLTNWAYVPEKNDFFLIKSKIYRSFTDKSYDGLSLDQIQRGIVESIKDKKYLLVLDDVWDEDVDKLNDLMNLLKCGNKGSKVIITTRSPVVASEVVDTFSIPYKLGTLTNDQSWDLFKSVAFKQGKENENSTFTKIGKEIVRMCGNVPIAIKVVGGFLRSKDSEKEWLQARDAQRSKAQLTKGDDIMDVLKLSYDYLPPPLKQCFAYCSLFSKGCRFDRVDLVYMWMAQGYCEPCNNEIDGDTLYMNMLARGFFQDPKFSDDGNVENCRMHDLLHDLAQHVASEESVVLHDESSLIQDTHGLRHLNLNCYKLTAEVRSSLFVARRLRSLISTVKVGNKDLKDLMSRLQHLRVLKVENIVGKTLPDAIGGLMHLRYLYIQSHEIEYLPNSITRLENLQTLDVQHCIDLRELPRDFAKLTNINHLLLPDFLISDLPRGFGKLTSLQVLNIFIVGENNGIDSLPVLNYRGNLTICFKKWRTNCIVEAQRANLKNCGELTSLELHFYGMVTVPIEEMNEMLMNLELPPNLRHLKVDRYQGEKMPIRWFDGLSKVVSITIVNCWNCTHLGWENLEMEEEEEETKEVAGNNNSRMRHREWQGLTSLRKLTLINIPKMKRLPSGITSLTTLDMLKIQNLDNLIEVPEQLGNLSMLRQLQILYCPKLKSLPTSLLSHTSLSYLEISGCPHLEERYRSPDGEDYHLIQHIPGVNIW